MSVFPNFFKVLESYMGKSCKVVFRDGGAGGRIKVFLGVLEGYDQKFQVWKGYPDKLPDQKCRLAINHDDVNRIVLEMGGGIGA